MKLFKLMASVCAVSAAFMFAACDDSSSASSNDEPSASNDCSVEDGVKVVSPKKGDSFKMGDTITVIYGSDVQGSGYRFVFKTSEEDAGLDMLEESAGPMKPDQVFYELILNYLMFGIVCMDSLTARKMMSEW